jgi:hypothetical protein
MNSASVLGLNVVWNSVTAPQATIISGVLTLCAAVLGILLGWGLLSNKVKDLKGAVDETDKILKEHRKSVEDVLKHVRSTLDELSSQLNSTTEGLGQLRGAVGDIQVATSPEELNEGHETTRETLRVAWEAIRDHLEQIAADPSIDGRTRARYNRMDRRRYGELVDALGKDGLLAGKLDLYRDAVTIWQKYRNGKKLPSSTDSRRLTDICSNVVGNI